ncbi:ATP-binding domain-containing protein [Streptomyces sp. PKU-MA01144]|uniref:helix-hairpin-helix domain-containing protein n=1 Tax=Streptomyces sp. PKU-MA01144 TaxID=2729138 RepID=UPI00147DC6E2|nr:helix-hairpin-helix domain-containing protein [Streptomyces sp. PKU-MA01144]NNJ06636.1 ATP-binding domain-containing protein [Streptomyces sp. PKU-MA01144]
MAEDSGHGGAATEDPVARESGHGHSGQHAGQHSGQHSGHGDAAAEEPVAGGSRPESGREASSAGGSGPGTPAGAAASRAGRAPDGVPGEAASRATADEGAAGAEAGQPASRATADEGAAGAEAGQPAGRGKDGGADGSLSDETSGVAETGATGGGSELSEAQAELAAQQELRSRIEKRKAGKSGPIAAGGKLSGTAADLLAAVRAVESGATPSGTFFEASAAPRKPAPTSMAGPGRPRVPMPEPAPRQPGPGTVQAVLEVLVSGGAPEGLATRVAGVLGEQAADALREDPWRLLAVPGVQPEQADGFARALLGSECRPDDGRRAAALVGWLLERAALRGHTALESATVRTALDGYSVPDPGEALRHAVAEGAVLVFQDGVDAAGEPAEAEEAGTADGHEAQEDEEPAGLREPVPVLLGLDRYALAEESLADGLARLVRTAQPASWEDAAGAAGSPSAAELIRAAAGHGLVAHTGGETARAEPAALVAAARSLGLSAVAAVHSENGRRRTGGGAVTVQGLLSGAEGPGRDGDGALAVDLLAVLDAPQLDVETAAALVESLPDGCRLVLSGDPGVLWSAGAGRVFADVLAARVCPVVASRTPDPGPLGELVSGIGVGELVRVDAPGKEAVIVPVRDAGEAVHRTVQLVADSVPRAIGVPPAETQVITVGHGGSAGTRALNAALKERFNPGPGRFGGFDPADRVAYSPAPGRTLTGSVVSADAEGLRVDCEGTAVLVPQDRVASVLRHGWAITAHQAAGMRWPAVVVVLPGDAAQGLNRPWVYTAFSRGERHLSVVHGMEQALPRAVAEIPSEVRTTRLRSLLEGLLPPGEAGGSSG